MDQVKAKLPIAAKSNTSQYQNSTGEKMSITLELFLALEIWGAVFALLIALCIFIVGRLDVKEEQVMLRILLATFILLGSDVVVTIADGRPGMYIHYVMICSDFILYVMGYVILALFSQYINALTRVNTLTRIISGIVLSGILLSIVNVFGHFMYYVDDANVYHRSDYFFLSQALGIAGMICLAIHLFNVSKEIGLLQTVTLSTYICLPSIAMIIQTFYFGFPLLNIAIAVSVIINFTVMLMHQRNILARQRQELVIRDVELAAERERVNKMKIRLILSQIKPHFLYNALNSIYYLIDVSPRQAQEAIDSFSDYLRGNLAALESDSPISFTKELQHVKSYLRLEEMRFQDELSVIYDIKADDFKIPALSVKAMVENAVKHGISQNEDGGYVKIESYETDNGYEIKIEDNGAGFDLNEVGKDGELHVGISNVKTRIETMSKGTLTIDSEVGKGTRVTIFIPKT